ncbi:unnamed protein product [Angiostrongylus costaricensis]|uniref:Aa_trans domain-containing protein n=1 Tax=Angiostrongylus costaricensis TaxID=334426 RepID=A0A158PF31_ANGCS|nr:unnamed protein product [Angiostrongylus costaricensis]
MMGVSTLCIPWGLYQAGFGFGLLLLVAVGMITSYTAYLVTSSKNKLGLEKPMLYDFPDICRSLYGRPGEILAVSFSIFVFIGAVLAYWVVMSNFFYFTGILFYVIMTIYDIVKISDECGFLYNTSGVLSDST